MRRHRSGGEESVAREAMGRIGPRGMGRRLMLCLVGSVIVLAAGAGAAQASVYWAHINLNDFFGAAGVGRAAHDGSAVNNRFLPTSQPVVAMTIRGTQIYFATRGSRNITRANLDGSGVNTTFIVNATDGSMDGVASIAVGQSNIYWANGRYVGRANLDGTNVDPRWLDVRPSWSVCPLTVTSVAVNTTHVYFARHFDDTVAPCSLHDVGRAGLDRSDVRSVVQPSEAGSIAAVALGPSHLYWLRFNGGRISLSGGLVQDIGYIGRANLDGSAANGRFITDVAAPNSADSAGLAVDSTGVYWASDFGVGKANLDGSGKNDRFVNVSGLLNLVTPMIPRAIALTPNCPSIDQTLTGYFYSYGAEGYSPGNGYDTTCPDGLHRARITYPTNYITEGGQVNSLHFQRWTGSYWQTLAFSLAPLFGAPAEISYIAGKGTYRWRVVAGSYRSYQPATYTILLRRPFP